LRDALDRFPLGEPVEDVEDQGAGFDLYAAGVLFEDQLVAAPPGDEVRGSSEPRLMRLPP
jgi:hypothetical protein